MRSPMQPRRPALVTWVAVFHLIFGGLFLLCGVGVGVTQLTGVGKQGGPPPAGEPPAQKEWREYREQYRQRLEEADPWVKTLDPVHASISLLLLPLLLVVAGVGLLMMRKWGWWASVAFGVLCLLVQIYYILFTLLYVFPTGGRVVEELLPDYPTLAGAAPLLRLMPALNAVLSALIMLYPAVVLLIMMLPSVRAAFRGEFLERPATEYDGGPGPDGAPPGAARDPGLGDFGDKPDRVQAPEDRPEAPH
jgi:hypothetical protein